SSSACRGVRVRVSSWQSASLSAALKMSGGVPVQGVLFAGNREIELIELPDPQPGPGEVVVKIMASGLCGSDLRPYRNDRRGRFVTGHEPCGIVHSVGANVPSEQAKVGDRVIVHHYSGCG